MKLYECPVCEGTGKEYCTNPDHGLGDREGSSFNCPCCGYGPTREIPNSRGCCEACDGIGVVYELDALSPNFEEYTSHLDIDLEDYEINPVNGLMRCYDPTRVMHESGVYYKHNQVQWLRIKELPHPVHQRNFNEAGLYVGYITWVGYQQYVDQRSCDGNLMLEELKFDFDLPFEIFETIYDDDIIPFINSGRMIFDPTPEQLDEMILKEQVLTPIAQTEEDLEMPLITISHLRPKKKIVALEMDTLKFNNK